VVAPPKLENTVRHAYVHSVLLSRCSKIKNTPRHFLFCRPPTPYIFFGETTPPCFSGSMLLHSAHLFGVPFSSMTLYIDPDKTVPYPESTEPEEAPTLRENMQIAANTAAVLKGLGAHYDESPTDQADADAVFQDFAKRAEREYRDAMEVEGANGVDGSDRVAGLAGVAGRAGVEAVPKRGVGRPRTRPLKEDKPPKNSPLLERASVAERIGTMLQEYNSQFVADAAELRLVVTNKLLDLAGCGDPRIEIKAAEMLGKISDVGLFSEKTEITVTYNNVSDLDEAIKDKIRKMMRLHAVDVPTLEIDVDKVLGLDRETTLIEDIEVARGITSPAEPPQESAGA